MEKVYSEESFVFNPIDNLKNKVSPNSTYKGSSALIKEEINNNNDDNIDETAFSVKEIRYREIKSIITGLSNDKKLNNTAIIHSEKLSGFLHEIFSESTANNTKGSEEIINILKEKFQNKYVFFAVNWVGCEDGLISITKLAFNNLSYLEFLLSKSFNFGAIYPSVNIDNQLELKLFLAIKNFFQK